MWIYPVLRDTPLTRANAPYSRADTTLTRVDARYSCADRILACVSTLILHPNYDESFLLRLPEKNNRPKTWNGHLFG